MKNTWFSDGLKNDSIQQKMLPSHHYTSIMEKRRANHSLDRWC